MSSRFFAIANRRRVFAALTIWLCPLPLTACFPPSRSTSNQSSKAVASPSPSRGPLVAYLFEGRVWIVSRNGADASPLNFVPAEGAIDEFLWSADGSGLYLAVGLHLYRVPFAGGKESEIGTVSAPEGTTLDRLQMSHQPGVIIVHTFDADASPHIYSFAIENRETRELTVDDYSALTPVQPPSVRGFSDFSVSRDLGRVLFKGTVGSSEQLFVADLEKGWRTQVTSIDELEGFEESAELEGGRRIIEAEWSPDGRFILFNPAQSCSDSGLCYGQLFLTDSWTGRQRRLSQGMMIGLEASWDKAGSDLLFEDAGKIMITSFAGEARRLAEGNRPKWQPVQ